MLGLGLVAGSLLLNLVNIVLVFALHHQSKHQSGGGYQLPGVREEGERLQGLNALEHDNISGEVTVGVS